MKKKKTFFEFESVWTFFDFDVFGTGDFQTVQGMRPSGVQYIFADSIHSYLTENQKTVKKFARSSSSQQGCPFSRS